MAGWREQWDRLNRWQGLVEMSGTVPRSDKGSSEHYLDELYAFCEAALHMRDWLAADTTSGVTWEAADKVIQQVPLRVAASIAIGSKHHVIKNTGYHGDAQVASQSVFVHVGAGTLLLWAIDAGGRTWDALLLVRDCREAWRAFLAGRGLL